MEPNNERKTPAGEQNELFKKQVFSDETLCTADPDEEETGEQHFETLTFDKPAVLDERFAARKAERETAQPPQAKPAMARGRRSSITTSPPLPSCPNSVASTSAGATLKLPTINASMKLPTASRQRADRIRMARRRVGTVQALEVVA